MNNDQKENYFMLLEDIKESIKRKVKFCKFIKVLEYTKPQKILNEAAEKIKELREIAKKLENIDGGMKKSKNMYKAKIEYNGCLTDIKSGKTLQLPISKMRSIINIFHAKKLHRNHDSPFLPSAQYDRITTSTPNLKQVTKLPKIVRNRVHKSPNPIKSDKSSLYRKIP